MCARENIVGRWKIVAWEQFYDDGRHIFPLGKDVEGYIQYDPDNRMACMLFSASRQKFSSIGPWDASAEERAAAFGSMIAYAGSFSVNGDVVSHHVELSAFPNWKESTLKRRIEVSGGQNLVLVARMEEGTTEARTARLTWRRS
ncbi:lipocalin-like domain-containing protein [Pandoraea iniqua]|nr:lipocalin-like domain-containing protein [Pandoraea iniqua]